MSISALSKKNQIVRIQDVLAKKFLPFLNEERPSPIVIARPNLKQVRMPDGVTLEPRKISGQRIALKHPNSAERRPHQTASWPQDNLREHRVPKLALIVSGRADLHISEYLLRCPEGTIVFIPPSVPHPDGKRAHIYSPNAENEHCDILWLSPLSGGLSCWVCHSRGDTHTGSDIGEKIFLANDRLVQYVNALDEEISTYERPNEKITQTLFRLLFMSICRDILEERSLPDGSPMEETPFEAGVDVIGHATQYIRSHLEEPLNLDLLARKACMSRSQFSKLFRLQTGQSVIEYVNDCRIERAKFLLVETTWPMSSISRNIGLKSVTYFHRFFRERLAVSPLSYRQSVRILTHSSSDSPSD
jgi:AraC-like DNA-binding protein